MSTAMGAILRQCAVCLKPLCSATSELGAQPVRRRSSAPASGARDAAAQLAPAASLSCRPLEGLQWNDRGVHALLKKPA